MKVQWLNAITNFQQIAPAFNRIKDSKDVSRPFQIRFNFLRIPYSGNSDEMNAATYRLKIQLYDITYCQFVGGQWESGPLKGTCDANSKFAINCNQVTYFHTTLIEESIVLVIEAVKEVLNPEGKCESQSLGWCIYRLFRTDMDIRDTSSKKDSTPIDIKMFKGSSRILLFTVEPIEKNPGLQLIDGLSVSFTLSTHKALSSVAHMIPQNTFVRPTDSIPGVIHDSKAKGMVDSLLQPKLIPVDDFIVEKMRVSFNPSILDFELALTEAVNKDRIIRDNRDKERDSGKMEIVERRLRIGVHNGWTYTDEVEVVHLLVTEHGKSAGFRGQHKRTSSLGTINTVGEQVELKAKNPVEITMPIASGQAIVFVLDYTIAEPKMEEDRRLTHSMGPSAQQTYEIRWTAYLPFDQSTGQSRDDLMRGNQLHLAMKGGPGINPDNTLYFNDKECPVEVYVDAVFAMKPKSTEKPALPLPIREPAQPHHVIERRISQSSDTLQPTPRSAITGYPPHIDPSMLSPRGTLMPAPHMAQMLLYSQMMRSLGSTPGYPDMSGSFDMIRESSIPPYVLTGPVIPMGLRVHTGKGLSRTAYARLYAAGFPRILDRNGESPEVVDPSSDIEVDLNREMKDPLLCNEIVLQFLAYAAMPDEFTSGHKLQSVYFTFQLYRFPQFTTPRLALSQPINEISSYDFLQPHVLQSVHKDGSLTDAPPGYQMKYNVDPDFLKPGEGRIFLSHMSQQILHIDVWDGDSLLLLGSCAVELKHLCRRGKEAVQVTYELDVLPSADCGDEEFSEGVHNGHASEIKGRLHLRLANIGYRATNQKAVQKVFVPQKKKTLVETTDAANFHGGSLARTQPVSWNSTDPSLSLDPLSSSARHVIRAQPAVTSDRELAELLDVRHSTGTKPLTTMVNGEKKSLTSRSAKGGGDTDEIELYGQGDVEKRRKLARMLAVRQSHPDAAPPDPAAVSILAYRADKMERMRDLKTIDIYRERAKRENILQMLSSGVCTVHHLYPSFGGTEFFEFELKNPYNTEQTIQILINDPQNSLSLVVDPREMRALKLMFNVTTPIEDDLFHWDQQKDRYTIFMRPKEKTFIPFRYVELGCEASSPPQCPTDAERKLTTIIAKQLTQERVIKVTFQSTTSDQLIGQLEVRLAPQPPIIDQSFRFYHPENSFLKKMIRLPPVGGVPRGDGADLTSVLTRCSDSSVICDSKPVNPGEPHDVYVKVTCGSSPQIRQFLVAVYVDTFMLRPAQVWQFTVHSQQRVDTSCLEHQTSKLTLLLKGSRSTRQVKVFSSHPAECAVHPSGPFTLAAGTVHELQVTLCPTRIGSRLFHVHVVDSEFHQLVRAWLVCAQVRAPEVSKYLEVVIPMNGGQGCNKRVAYINPYPHTKTFSLITNRPDLLAFKSNTLSVAGGDTSSIGLRFLPSPYAGVHEIRVYLNDEEGKNEETFAITAQYQG